MRQRQHSHLASGDASSGSREGLLRTRFQMIRTRGERRMPVASPPNEPFHRPPHHRHSLTSQYLYSRQATRVSKIDLWKPRPLWPPCRSATAMTSLDPHLLGPNHRCRQIDSRMLPMTSPRISSGPTSVKPSMTPMTPRKKSGWVAESIAGEAIHPGHHDLQRSRPDSLNNFRAPARKDWGGI